MIEIRTPNIRITEQKYILDIFFNEFFGIPYDLQTYNGSVVEISNQKSSKKLTIDASFFHNADKAWLKHSSLPKLPLKTWRPESDKIELDRIKSHVPVIYGSTGVQKIESNLHINIDIFGSSFFMLSRYEELICKDRDDHDRFCSSSSVAFKADFLDRPIVDEYAQILISCMKRIWPELNFLNKKPRMLISCDVDRPFDHNVDSLNSALKTSLADIIKRKDPIQFFKRLNRYLFNKFDIYYFDPFYCFDWYMRMCEENGLVATFYFIPTSKESGNGLYEITDKRIISLLRKIHHRGHYIGVHGSYNTYRDKEKIINEKKLFEKVLENQSIPHKIIGNRQHYLRWDSFVTPDYLEAANFEYDSSGSYADRSGFRYGTSKEFSMWGWQSYKKLNLKQQPLIVMECSVISKSYMGLGNTNQAKEYILNLKKNSFEYGGNFSLLWHNSDLLTANDKSLFLNILSSYRK